MNEQDFELSQVLRPTREQLEAQHPDFVESVSQAKNAAELVAAIRSINEEISGYCSEDNISLIEMVIKDRRGVPGIIKNTFTRTFGLRDKVLELAQPETK